MQRDKNFIENKKNSLTNNYCAALAKYQLNTIL